MTIEKTISEMMKINTYARLWHWMTDVAQHHTTFEDFLKQNETMTDSLMESALGNEVEINFSNVGVNGAVISHYSIEEARLEIKNYRSQILETKSGLEQSKMNGAEEFITILDGVVELSSKTLYLLRLK